MTFRPLQGADTTFSVLVEKPITPTAAQAHELIQLARSKGLILAVYQNRRWDSDFLTVQKLIREGTVRSGCSRLAWAGQALVPARARRWSSIH